MQQRNIRNEIIVALSVVVVLAFAITFAVVLSLTSPNNGDATPSTETILDSTQDTNIGSAVSETPSATSTLFETLVSMPQDCILYTVEVNDTLESIASIFGVSAADIALANNLASDAALQAGQNLIVPLVGCVLLPTQAATTVVEAPTSTETDAPTVTDVPTLEPSATDTPIVLTGTPTQNTLSSLPTDTRNESPTLTPTETLTQITATNTPTRTDTPTATLTDTSTETPTETSSPIVPTETSIPTSTETPTDLPTLTPTETPTEFPTETPTETPTAISTATLTETATDMPTATPTDLPTETYTPTIPTSTETPTSTATFTPTFTDTATLTPTETPTSTPTATDTSTSTSTPVLDIGLQPTPTFPQVDILPTPTPFITLVPTLSPAQDFCLAVPQDWVIYSVQEGDTLLAIAQAVNANVLDLMRVNCLSDADSIGVGVDIYVPSQPVAVIATGLPPATFVSAELCHDIDIARIISPSIGQQVSGIITIIGTATLPDFLYYRFDIRHPNSDTYEFLTVFNVPIVNGVLGQLDTQTLENGLYWLRLSVVNRDGNVPFNAICSVPVQIDN
jgi:LysM repeat protein